jgi:hypothetical protein
MPNAHDKAEHRDSGHAAIAVVSDMCLFPARGEDTVGCDVAGVLVFGTKAQSHRLRADYLFRLASATRAAQSLLDRFGG